MKQCANRSDSDAAWSTECYSCGIPCYFGLYVAVAPQDSVLTDVQSIPSCQTTQFGPQAHATKLSADCWGLVACLHHQAVVDAMEIGRSYPALKVLLGLQNFVELWPEAVQGLRKRPLEKSRQRRLYLAAQVRGLKHSYVRDAVRCACLHYEKRLCYALHCIQAGYD
jgi:hypothetical protein